MNVETLVRFAKEVEIEDPIDWGMLNINEDDAYKLVASSILEQFNEPWNINNQTAMLATITKLVVENFVLNLKLLEKE
jgi:hypothetical protein